MSETRTLRCGIVGGGIVGAGIAGLGAAIALCRAGHNVEIFEHSTLKSEIGAAMTLTPNANLILDHWGFDATKAQETDKCQYRRLQWDTLQHEHQDSFGGVREKHGHMFNAFHRVDLHNGLRELAEIQYSVAIRLGAEVCHVDCDAGTLKLTGGTLVEKDFIVVADGDKSQCVKDVAGKDVCLRKTDKSVFRTLMPMGKIMSDEGTRSLFENQASGFLSSTVSETGVFIMTYPCRSDELLNWAIFHTRKEDHADPNDWNASATVEQAMKVLQGSHPKWCAIISKADFMKVYTIGYRDVLPRIIKGKVVLIGDAAHPMMPTHGQGGCMALEDAATLEVLMANMTSNETVEPLLQLFQDVRLPRSATTQIISNAMFYSKSLDWPDMIRRYYQGPLPMPDAEPWSVYSGFFYSYDVFWECKKAMQYHDKAGGGT